MIGNMFDFALFLTLTVAIFSIIGCIGLGVYAVLGNKSPKSEIENDKDLHQRVIGDVLSRKR